MFPSLAKKILAAGQLHHFRNPIARRHERLNPFNAGDARRLLHHAGFFDDAYHPIFQAP